MAYIYIYNNYDLYLKLGKERYLFDNKLYLVRDKLNSMIDRKDFNRIYRRIVGIINE